MCNAPIVIKNDYGLAQKVQCGRCLACQRRKKMSWTLRCLLENSEHAYRNFVTLTYAPQNYPGTLDVEHIQLFLKRLRKSARQPVRYFISGEFGPKTNRAHWHGLIWMRTMPEGLRLCDVWGLGHVREGSITAASAQYVVRYNTAKTEDRETLMSRRPGIGLPYLRRFAAKLAEKVPEMAYYPPVVTFEKKSWWLDRSAYEACVQAYTDAGGELAMCRAPSREPEIDPCDTMSSRGVSVAYERAYR